MMVFFWGTNDYNIVDQKMSYKQNVDRKSGKEQKGLEFWLKK